ncbi:hypothetical protein FF38_07494 [Lucilia cuprina]|uniref:Uncharacterized protein n=1 Tax=Lucilia cuprina TaxID=7375 RepID=A0A0L0CNA7_LUCCU|nr:hypothetical protein FF38_07494 [Lucilia cuprina]
MVDSHPILDGHSLNSNSVVSNPNIFSAKSTSSTYLESVSATIFSDPFLCSIIKSKLCSCNAQRAKRPFKSLRDISHLRLAWSVITVKGINSTYGLNLLIANTAAKHSFSFRFDVTTLNDYISGCSAVVCVERDSAVLITLPILFPEHLGQLGVTTPINPHL